MRLGVPLGTRLVARLKMRQGMRLRTRQGMRLKLHQGIHLKYVLRKYQGIKKWLLG